MTPKQAIHMLIDIVAKGGNLLYNIGPAPDGTWPEAAYKLLDEMGKWITVNGEAIYSTRAISPYKTDNICLTQQKNTKAVYAIYLEQGDDIASSDATANKLPESFVVKGVFAASGAKVNLLGSKENLKWENTAEGVKIMVPEKIRKKLPCELAWSFRISAVK
jgi:alpha-L-fucosidase